MPQFAVRPSRAQQGPDGVEAALAWFSVAERELPLDVPKEERAQPAGRLANERAELLLLLGRREEGIAQWQAFLDAYPTAEDFPAYAKKLESAMLLSDEAEAAEAQLERCDVALLDALPAHATRRWRAGGRKGLFGLGEALLRCATKDERFARLAWSAVYGELHRVGDCEGATAWAARAAKGGVSLGRGAQPCDAP